MRLRMGLAMGFGAGYVLGAKAGRQRYEQIRAAWATVMRSEPAQHLSSEVREVAHKAGEQIEAKASDGVHKVTEMVRGVTGGGDGNGHQGP